VSHHIWVVPLVALALAQLAAIATSVYLHRGLAHRALRFHPVADVCFRTQLWLTTGQNRREWVAVHRKHHKFTDREGDPHSPQLLGFWRVQLLNVYYYIREARNPETVRTFAPDIAEDWWDRTVFSSGLTGLALGITLLCVVLGVWAGLVVALMHAALYVFVLAPVINGLGHWRGAQNFTNTAYNSRLLAWVTGGESLHNNHHAYPRAPKFSMRWFEFDPSWVVIRCLAAVGQVEVVGAPVRLPRRPSASLGWGSRGDVGDRGTLGTRLKPDMEESDGNRAARGVGASAGRSISDVVPQPELGLSAQRRIGRGAADRAPARFVGTLVSRRDQLFAHEEEQANGWLHERGQAEPRQDPLER
jgi:stearoyl-CoA desaturase (delta-9 desaturase)